MDSSKFHRKHIFVLPCTLTASLKRQPNRKVVQPSRYGADYLELSAEPQPQMMEHLWITLHIRYQGLCKPDSLKHRSLRGNMATRLYLV